MATEAEPVLILEASKCCHGTLIRFAKYEGQETKGVLDHVQLTVGPTHNPSVFVSLVPECIIIVATLNNWQKHRSGSLICGVRAIVLGKAK